MIKLAWEREAGGQCVHYDCTVYTCTVHCMYSVQPIQSAAVSQQNSAPSSDHLTSNSDHTTILDLQFRKSAYTENELNCEVRVWNVKLHFSCDW